MILIVWISLPKQVTWLQSTAGPRNGGLALLCVELLVGSTTVLLSCQIGQI